MDLLAGRAWGTGAALERRWRWRWRWLRPGRARSEPEIGLGLGPVRHLAPLGPPLPLVNLVRPPRHIFVSGPGRRHGRGVADLRRHRRPHCLRRGLGVV